MAKIHNPQNQYGQDLATKIHVDTIVNDKVIPLEEGLKKSFENITTDSEYLSVKSVEGEEKNTYKTTISANVVKDITDDEIENPSLEGRETSLASFNVVKKVADATGIKVGLDLDKTFEISEDEKLKNKVRNMNFFGEYVNVVETDAGSIDIYIGRNNNNPSYSSITDTLANENYVYASSTSAYALPSDAAAGSKYARTSSLTGTETVSINGGAAIGNILVDQTITVTVTSDKGTITYTTSKISEQAGTTTASKNYTWENEYATKGIKVAGTDLIKYASTDAKDGYTPNSTTGKFVVTIDNDKVVGTNGGWYSVSVKLGNTTKSTAKVFVYPAASATPSIGKPVITYAAGGTKKISGLTYDSSGSFTLTVDNIANTQQAITKDTNRVKVTKTAGDADFSATVATNTAGMSVTGTATNETAIYKYTATKSVTNTTAAKKVSAAAKAQAYGQSGLAGSEQTSNTCTASTFLYTDNGDDTDLVTKFQKDGARKKATLADAKSAAGATVNYDSSKSLITEYTDQLLVQYGTVRYPNADATGRYSGATGTRYYVRPVKFGGSGQINTISVTVSGWANDYQHSKTRLYLIKQGEPDVMVLNCYRNSSSSYGTPIAKEHTPSSGKWTCEINNELWHLYGGTTGYYLVIEMDATNNTTVGQITLA